MPAGRTLEPDEWASEPAGRAPELAGRALDWSQLGGSLSKLGGPWSQLGVPWRQPGRLWSQLGGPEPVRRASPKWIHYMKPELVWKNEPDLLSSFPLNLVCKENCLPTNQATDQQTNRPTGAVPGDQPQLSDYKTLYLRKYMILLKNKAITLWQIYWHLLFYKEKYSMTSASRCMHKLYIRGNLT